MPWSWRMASRSPTPGPDSPARLGRNGAGKSTIIRMITNILAPDAGQVPLLDAVRAEFTPLGVTLEEVTEESG